MTIWRGAGGGGDATTDSEINLITALANSIIADTATTTAAAASATASELAAQSSEDAAAISETNSAASAAAALVSEGAASVSAAAALVSENNAAASALSVNDTNLVHIAGTETITGTKTFSNTIVGSVNGNAATVTNGVYTATDQTIGGNKTFSNTVLGSISGATGTFSGNVQMASLNGGPISLRNKIINGGCQVAQRGNVSLSASYQYGGCDRFMTAAIGGTGVSGGIAQATGQSTATGFAHGIINGSWTTGQASIIQRIESLNAFSLNGKTVTISGKLFHNFGANRTVAVKLYKANASNNFTATTQIGTTQTFIAASGSYTSFSFQYTLGASDASNGLQVEIVDSVAGSFGSVNFVSSELQLELGPVATPFEQRPYGMELALCQRYFQKSHQASTAPGTSSNLCISSAYAAETTRLVSVVNRFPVVMRATPSVQIYSETGSAGLVSTTGGVNAGSTMIATLVGDAGFGEITGTGLTINTTYRAHWTASAEL